MSCSLKATAFFWGGGLAGCRVGLGAGSVARAVFFDEVREVLFFDCFELFAGLLYVFEGFHDGLGHAFVGFLGASHDGELLGLGDAFVAIVVVQTNSEEVRLLVVR